MFLKLFYDCGRCGSMEDAVYVRIRKPKLETYLEAVDIWTSHLTFLHLGFNYKMGIKPPFSHNFKALL